MPSAAELPSFETANTETPSPLNPLGAKGIGESGTIGSTPAVQNAVVDALGHLGVRHVDMPCTPERVWRAIQDAKRGHARRTRGASRRPRWHPCRSRAPPKKPSSTRRKRSTCESSEHKERHVSANGNNNWGRWGDDDERGALNLLTPRPSRAGAAAVTTGKVYSLGIPIQATGVPILDYRGTPMRLTLMNESDDGRFAMYGAHEGTGAHEDILVFASHTTSHMDALCHVYENHQHYNGVAASEMKTHTGAGRLGIEKVSGFAGRGVMLDFPKLKGVPWLEPGTMITAADLDAAEQAQGVTVGSGDIVLLRTGYLDMWFEQSGDEGYAQPGHRLRSRRVARRS